MKMFINLSDILTTEGSAKEIDSELDIKKIEYLNSSYLIKGKVKIYVKVMNLGDKKIEVDGSFESTILIPCSRCIKEVPYTINENFSKDFDLNYANEDSPDDEEQLKYLDGYNLNIIQLISDEILLHFPMKVLCSNNCKGICKTCGCDLNMNSCNCDKTDIDPRMDVFKDILKDL